MQIQWLGHSCFKLTESTGKVIVTDPYNDYVGYKMESIKADVVTISHHHKDHDAIQNILGNPTIIDEVGDYKINGVSIKTLVSAHDNEGGIKRGKNHIYIYKIDGIDICHMGDIGEECTIKLVESIGSVKVLMIPVGGNYTIDAKQAKDYVDLLKPNIVIPMHYKTTNCNFDIDGVSSFIKLFDKNQIIKVNGDSIELNVTQFEKDCTKVYLFSQEKF